MNEILLKEEQRLCRKYGVSGIDKVLDIQYKILKDIYKSNSYYQPKKDYE